MNRETLRGGTIVNELLDNLPKVAPPVVPPEDRTAIYIDIPGKRGTFLLDYDQAEKLHKELGQSLAIRMRRRGSSTLAPNPDDVGGTPAAGTARLPVPMRLAA